MIDKGLLMNKHVLNGIASTMVSLGLCGAPAPIQAYGGYSRSYARQNKSEHSSQPLIGREAAQHSYYDANQKRLNVGSIWIPGSW